MKAVRSPLALDRVAEIADEIAADRPQAADTWVEIVLSAMERLAEFPYSG